MKIDTFVDVMISKTSASYLLHNRYDLAIISKLRYHFSNKGFISEGLGIDYNDAEEDNAPFSEQSLGGRTCVAPEFGIGLDIGRIVRKGSLKLKFPIP